LTEKIIFGGKNNFWPKKSFSSKKIFFGGKNHSCAKKSLPEKSFGRIFNRPLFARTPGQLWLNRCLLVTFLTPVSRNQG